MSWPDVVAPRPLTPPSMSLHRVAWEEGDEQSGPISLADAKAYARITSTAEDTLAADMLAGAVEYAENATRRTIAHSLWDLVIDSFPSSGLIELRRPPVIEVVELQYRNTNQVWTEIASADYELELDGDHARLGPLYGQSWPGVSSAARSVRVRYRAGYRPHDSDIYAEVPLPPVIGSNLKTGICELFTWRFHSRGAGSTNKLIEVAVPSAIDAALWSERVDL